MTDNDVEYWRDRAHCAEQDLAATTAELANHARRADHWRVAAQQHRARVEALVAKAQRPAPEPPKEIEVVDLVAALRATIEAAKQRRADAERADA